MDGFCGVFFGGLGLQLHPYEGLIYIYIEPKVMEVWMEDHCFSFLNVVIYRFQPFIFQGV